MKSRSASMCLIEDMCLINDAKYQEGCTIQQTLRTSITRVYGMVDKYTCRQQHKGRMLQLEKCSLRLRRQTARQKVMSLMEKLQM